MLDPERVIVEHCISTINFDNSTNESQDCHAEFDHDVELEGGILAEFIILVTENITDDSEVQEAVQCDRKRARMDLPECSL